MPKQLNEDSHEIRVTNVNKKLKGRLIQAALKKGIPLSTIMKDYAAKGMAADPDLPPEIRNAFYQPPPSQPPPG